jgi:hypothetical protein
VTLYESFTNGRFWFDSTLFFLIFIY